MATLDEDDFSSDTSDDDYVPEEEVGSEEEESGEEEAPLEGDDNDQTAKPKKAKAKKGKKRKKKETAFTRKRQGGIKLDDEDNEEKETEDSYNAELAQKISEEEEQKKEENEKKKVDDLWASFKADVGAPKPKPKPPVKSTVFGSLTSVVKTASSPALSTKTSNIFSTSKTSEAKSDKLTITKEFDFAGEIVKVTKEVDINSKEAKQELKKQEESKKKSESSSGPSIPGIKRSGGGLGGVLGLIGKKPKMGTLDKSKLDWEKFKEKEGIQEELQSYNKGKDGYIERQAFLNRADVRQFEIERDIRLGTGKR